MPHDPFGIPYPSRRGALQLLLLALGIDRTRTLRGAVSGTVAAAVWAAQQPLDKLIARGQYDDVELLGRAFTRGERWYPIGLAAHLANGAVFGGVYANIAPTLPIPPALRGPAVALVENFASWPLGAISDRLHPGRQQLPTLRGNRVALAQATWRHLLFGIVLGELERRLNAEPEPVPPVPEADYSSNGHGPIEHALSVTASATELPGDPDE
jgi:hypothetical protein